MYTRQRIARRPRRQAQHRTNHGSTSSTQTTPRTHQLLAMQRAIGNQAVIQMLKQGTLKREQSQSRSSAAPGVIQREIEAKELEKAVQESLEWDGIFEMPEKMAKRLPKLAEIATEFEKVSGWGGRHIIIEVFADAVFNKLSDEQAIKNTAFKLDSRGFKVPEKYKDKRSQAEILEYQQLQSGYRKEPGRADAAKQLAEFGATMPGRFSKTRWVGSGPDDKRDFMPAIDKEDKGINHFARWIDKLAAKDPAADDYEPTTEAGQRMNCWEGVMFTAYQAKLVDKEWLARIHVDAAKQGSGAEKEGDKAYFDRLATHLGHDNAAPVDLESGLIPEVGDIVFFDQMEHVALSLGGGKLMHLWHSTEGGKHSGFEITSIEAIFNSRPDMKHKTTFAPCPFKVKEPTF